MKNLYLVVFLFTQLFYAQQNIFDAARTGTAEDVRMLMKTNPDIINQKNENGHTPLILATYRGNTEVALFLINTVKNLNDASADGTALMAAVVSGNTELVKALLEKNADTDIADGNGTTALLYATMFRNTEVVELLVNSGANVYLKDNKDNNALDYAQKMKEEKIIKILKNKML